MDIVSGIEPTYCSMELECLRSWIMMDGSQNLNTNPVARWTTVLADILLMLGAQPLKLRSCAGSPAEKPLKVQRDHRH